MKYLIRAVKYFCEVVIILVVVMGILILMGIVEADINLMFKDGYDSVKLILAMFAVVSLLYPRFGYNSRLAIIPGEYSEVKQGIIDYMEDRNYVLESEEGECLTFRSKSIAMKLARMYEDRITMTREFTGFRVEGPTKDIVRVVYGLETKFKNPEE